MEVRFSLTKRLAELAGFQSETVQLSPSERLDGALRQVAHRFQGTEAAELTENGRLHSSILVVVDGTACRPNQAADVELKGGEDIDLLLPIAGG